MNILKLRDLDDTSEATRQAARVLERGGLVCIPCNGSYRLMTDLEDRQAVFRLFQSKRRVSSAPSLVFIPTLRELGRVATNVDPVAVELAKNMWPGPLTIRFDASPDLDRKVVKQLVKATGKVGVRITDDPIATEVVETFGGPLLVSSANRENKHGETSPAQIRQNFLGRLDLFLDAGDLSGGVSSTVVDVVDDQIKIVRPGTLAEETIRAAAE